MKATIWFHPQAFQQYTGLVTIDGLLNGTPMDHPGSFAAPGVAGDHREPGILGAAGTGDPLGGDRRAAQGICDGCQGAWDRRTLAGLEAYFPQCADPGA